MANDLMAFDRNELLNIFETEEDRRGTDILAMSNYFDRLVTKIDSNVINNGKWEDVADPSGMLGQIAIAIKSGFDISNINMFVADTSHFSKDIVDGLKNGLYHIGQSKEVEGRLRPVILDQNERIKKFITLRKAINPSEILMDMSNMTMQLSLRHISSQIESVSKDVQDINRLLRRETLYAPFLKARDRIMRAANTSGEKQENYLHEADEKLADGLTSLYLDLQEEILNLYGKTGLFQNLDEIDAILNRINIDMQLIPKYVGMRAYLFGFLGDVENANQVIADYRYQLEGLATNRLGQEGKYTALEMIHRYYPYNNDDMDFWIERPVQLISVLKNYETLFEQRPQEMYYIDMETNAA